MNRFNRSVRYGEDVSHSLEFSDDHVTLVLGFEECDPEHEVCIDFTFEDWEKFRSLING